MKITKYLLFIFGLSINFANAQNKTSKPNIVLIFADDLGYMDVGFNGNKQFETPNLDALSKKGMVFSNAYAGAGNCAPSRGCLLSGKYTPRHGIYAVGSTTRGPKSKMKVVPVPNTMELNTNFITMAEALKIQGYATGLFGKWHLGSKNGTSPEAQGFDVYFDSRKENPNKKREEPNDPKGIFSLTEAACNFITSNKDNPFFTFLSHHAIHSSLEARPESIEKFKKKGLNDKMAIYAACTYDLDASIAIVLEHLKKTGLDKNTMIIFTSDNGATQQSIQEPLRGNKGAYYEGGIREPFIAYFPEKIKPGTNSTPIINLDLYPTFLNFSGGKIDKSLDGESLLPLFWGQQNKTKREAIFWHFPGYLDVPVTRGRDVDFRTRPVTVMRKGNWKIHLYHEEWILDGASFKKIPIEAIELYNLKEDEGERVNLAKSNPDKKEELQNELLKWLKTNKVPLPKTLKSIKDLNDSDGSEIEN